MPLRLCRATWFVFERVAAAIVKSDINLLTCAFALSHVLTYFLISMVNTYPHDRRTFKSQAGVRKQLRRYMNRWCLFVRLYVCMFVCLYIYMYLCMYVYVCMYICIYVYMCVYIVWMCIVHSIRNTHDVIGRWTRNHNWIWKNFFSSTTTIGSTLPHRVTISPKLLLIPLSPVRAYVLHVCVCMYICMYVCVCMQHVVRMYVCMDACMTLACSQSTRSPRLHSQAQYVLDASCRSSRDL